MTGKRKEIGLFGDCQSTNLPTVNHYFPQIARRTTKKPPVDDSVALLYVGFFVGLIWKVCLSY